VFSEAFFETPARVATSYPAVYEQLRAFYRQDPLARLGSQSGPAQAQQRAHDDVADPAPD
jgi:Mlc titration factor MtfA (ptsG expression regulator)